MLKLNCLQKMVLSGSAICAAVLALPTASALAQDDADWEITIRYAEKEEAPKFEKNGLTYEQAYNAIPFNRAEYDANPSYRHDSAMELLFDQMRPTTIIRTQDAQASKFPAYNRLDYRWSHPYDYGYGGYYYGGWRRGY